MEVSALYSFFLSFLFAFTRLSGLFIYAPIFSALSIPNLSKVLLCSVFSYIIVLTGVVDVTNITDPIFFIILKETLFGIIIGYISYTFTSVFLTAGKIIDMKLGFGMANVVDPQNKMQVSLYGNFYYMFVMLVFLAIDGHHLLLRALYESYKFVGVGAFSFSKAHLELIIESFVKAFEFGINISFPIIVTILLSDLILGVLSKTIPQLNIFVVGMPLKIIVGLVILMFLNSSYFEKILVINDYMKELLMRFIRVR